MTKLRISNELALPLDFVTSTQAILAKKGSGKSYTASVQAEELLEAGQHVIAVDPTGSWFGLRSSADGRHAGYPIAVLGGEHGDVALETTAGEVIADAIATEHFSAVIDLSLFRKGEANRFMGAFLETLYRKNRSPLHLFIDEADLFAPQRPFGDEARTLGATEDIVRRGRIRGIGCTLITQRPQVLAKNVLSQVDMLTALRMNHPKDIAAIKEWVAVHGDEDQAKKMIADLPSLPIGEAWVWAPATDLFARVPINRRRTFDSGRTPKTGERVATPKKLAEVDIQRLGTAIAATVERAKADNPKVLKARISELEKQIAAKPGAKVETKVVEKSVVKDSHLQRIGVLIDQGERIALLLESAGEKAAAVFESAHNKALLHGETLRKVVADLRAIAKPLSPQTGRQADERVGTESTGTPKLTVAGSERRSRVVTAGETALTGPQRELLASLMWWRDMGHAEPTKAQLAGKAGWKVKGSHLRNRLAELHGAGLISYPRSGTIALTEEGIAASPASDTRVTLLDSIRASLTGPQIEVFEAVREGGEQTREELGERLGWDPGGSHLRNRLAELSAMELVGYPNRGRVVLQGWVS